MEFFRTFWARLSARPDSEHEQALIRLVLGTVGWLVALVEWENILARDHGTEAVVAIAAFYASGIAILAHIYFKPEIHKVRRYIGLVCDVCFITLALLIGHSSNVQGLVALYLWVPVGNGLRYGKEALLASLALSMLAFVFVMHVLPFWQQYRWFGIELLIGQILIALYARALVVKVQGARETAERANRAKTLFLAAASHDLRQPMQALSLYASTLTGLESYAGEARVVSGIQLSVQTLEQLFDSLLDISKIESGVIKPKLAAFPLQTLLERIVQTERPLAGLKNIEIDLIRTRISVWSDALLLERIIKNLLANAVRYTEKGRVAVGCRRLADNRVRICIVDTGIGISAAEQNRIFDEFYQVHNVQGQGFGLGLTIVRSLTDLLGHKLMIRSRVGRGSSFGVELEIAASQTPQSAAVVEVINSVAGACVVVVDDDERIRESMKLLLEQWGCKTVLGAKLADVENQLLDEGLSPDIVIADYHLAQSNGIELINQLRKRYGATLPALLISGTANIEELRSNSFAIPIIGKPVQAAKIRAFINHSLR